MNYCTPEPTLNQLLADPLIHDVMKADQVNSDALATMLRSTARHFAADQTQRESSIVGRLVRPLMSMLATYYGAALCGCMHSQFQICKAS